MCATCSQSPDQFQNSLGCVAVPCPANSAGANFALIGANKWCRRGIDGPWYLGGQKSDHTGTQYGSLEACEQHNLSADDASFALGLPGGPIGGGDACCGLPGGSALDLDMDDACDIDPLSTLASNEPGGGGCPNGGGDTINSNSGGGDAARVYSSPHLRPTFSKPPPSAATRRFEFGAPCGPQVGANAQAQEHHSGHDIGQQR